MCDVRDGIDCEAFNAITSSSCIIDQRGIVIRANKTWKSFSDDQRCTPVPGHAIGMNYLEVCERSASNGDADAEAIVERLRAVLEGYLNKFSIEYPCDTPAERLWFLMRVSSFEHDGSRYAVVVHEDITQHVTMEASLMRANWELDEIARRRAAEVQHLQEVSAMIAAASNDGIWEWTIADDVLFTSHRLVEIVGGEPPLTGRQLWGRIHQDDAERIQLITQQKCRIGGSFDVECRVIRGADGSLLWVRLRGHAVAGPDGRIARLVGTLADVTARHESEQLARAGERVDPITRLPNGEIFLDRLSHALLSGRQAMTVVCVLDLDDLAEINHRHGSHVGNVVICESARRIEQVLGPGAMVARLGGDKFAMFMPAGRHTHVEQVFRRIMARLAEPLWPMARDETLMASIGYVVADHDDLDTDPEGYLSRADLAMLVAKSEGGNQWQAHQPGMRKRARERNTIINALRRAFSGEAGRRPEGFSLAFQPIVDQATGRRVGFEALARWTHAVLGPVSPNLFIPIAEETGLIVAVGDWALREACSTLADLRCGTEELRDCYVAVNVAAQQFHEPDFKAKILSCLMESGLQPHHLKIEVTERNILDNALAAAQVLGSLSAEGIKVSIDDFGTGFSSLSYLSQFHFDELKIDRSFVREMVGCSRSRSVVKLIVKLAAELDMNVVAEGVEQWEEVEALRELGCNQFQGYLYGRPASPEEFLGRLHG